MSLLLNALRAVSVRVFTPWTGVWIADVDVDMDDADVLPTGRAVITTTKGTLVGSVDEQASGKYGAKATVRVVGGLGWCRSVPARQWKNDAGVLSTSVFSSTAAEVGETVVDVAPSRLGAEFDRIEGCASSVLDGAAWWVDAAGVTTVGPRSPRPVDPTEVQVLSWDPHARRAEIASDELVVPGSILVDPLFGRAVVRDVEQLFDAAGARATAWCSTDADASEPAAGGRLADTVSRMVRAAVRPELLREYAYRVVSQGADGRVTLQLVDEDAGVPKALKGVPIWPGVPNLATKVRPAAVVRVGFLSRTQPVVTGFDGASSAALELAFGSGRAPVVVAGTTFVQWVTAVTTAINSLAPGSATPPTDMLSTLLRSD